MSSKKKQIHDVKYLTEVLSAKIQVMESTFRYQSGRTDSDKMLYIAYNGESTAITLQEHHAQKIIKLLSTKQK